MKPANFIDGCFRRTGNLFSRYCGPNNIFYRLAKFSKCFYYILTGKKIQYQSYRGPVVSKRETLKKYKFAICYENSIFPGWITEKIFDCFLAGCVPIYLGDPNVTDRIPRDAFIDMRQFKSYSHLYDYIKGMSDTEYLKYIDAIKAFIGSEANYSFTAECFADTICSEILK